MQTHLEGGRKGSGALMSWLGAACALLVRPCARVEFSFSLLPARVNADQFSGPGGAAGRQDTRGYLSEKLFNLSICLTVAPCEFGSKMSFTTKGSETTFTSPTRGATKYVLRAVGKSRIPHAPEAASGYIYYFIDRIDPKPGLLGPNCGRIGPHEMRRHGTGANVLLQP